MEAIEIKPTAWGDIAAGTGGFLTADKALSSGLSPLYDQAALDAAVAAERERCAKVCEDSDVYQYDDPGGFFANLIRNA